jgi:lipopolysaccharide/colanic/teichoic acid biosynthesis glycosyltransferase
MKPIPYPLTKRAADKILAGGLLLLVSPVVLAVLLAFAIDLALSPADRGPILYREVRISRGRRFNLLKFRTLRTKALTRVAGHAGPHELDSANLTWVGRRVLKPWYLDEIPQFLNVLRGEISLVGPRPWPPELVERQVADGRDYRLRITAGLTGPAQVTKGLGASYAELDEEYVARSASLGGGELVRFDLGILVQTLKVIARGEGLSY